MTFKNLLLRWILLAAMLFSLLILYHFTDRSALAGKFVPHYVPMSQEQARLAAAQKCDTSYRRFTENCSALDQQEVDFVLMAHRRDFEREHIEPVLGYLENVGFAVCFAFAAAGIWFLWQWLTLQWSTRIAGARQAFGSLTSLAKIDERLKSRRMKKANADFLTLKNLFDNGLISEADFLTRKDLLAASVAGAVSRNR
ncbi:hypothetical protein [Rhizobacter sp. Root404]|uniref:hypothetical protein n=1 Tax=Rhizobacter sp. Root404 TaxID=1736528 RepID=UPI0006FF3BFC|nr:hypothetical protein [Rhizobacter sp. Root404]KQW38428.1 hypothetical protein ASC76_10465 [Rhizobacter sp. Root404]